MYHPIMGTCSSSWTVSAYIGLQVPTNSSLYFSIQVFVSLHIGLTYSFLQFSFRPLCYLQLHLLYDYDAFLISNCSAFFLSKFSKSAPDFSFTSVKIKRSEFYLVFFSRLYSSFSLYLLLSYVISNFWLGLKAAY